MNPSRKEPNNQNYEYILTGGKHFQRSCFCHIFNITKAAPHQKKNRKQPNCKKITDLSCIILMRENKSKIIITNYQGGM